MANIVYADPGSSYIKGQQAGQEAVINQGMAARRFRAADLSPEVQAWYLPFKQREQAALTGQQELTLNNGLLDTTGKLAALGAPGRNAFYGVANNVAPGANFSDASFKDPQQAFSQIGEASGNVPYSFGIPNVVSSGHYGTVRDITPTYGGQANAPTANGYNAYNNPNASPWATPPAPPAQPHAPTQPNPVQPNPTGGAGGVNSNYMIHPGNVPGYSTQAGQGGQPVLPGDKMGVQ